MFVAAKIPIMRSVFAWLCFYLSNQTKIAECSTVPDLHWTFDVNENNETYEVNSVTENVGRILSGTKIVPSNERYGSVAYFDGRHPEIAVDNLTSSCFLNASTCKQGLAFSFWIKLDGMDLYSLYLSSPSVQVRHFYDTIYSYILNGSNVWPCTSEGDRMLEREWVHYLVSWNKIDCRAYKNGKLVDVGKSFSSKGTIHGTRLDIGRYGFGKMWLDDLKVWERPLGEEEAYQVYRSGIYNSNLFKWEDISDEPQFSYLFQAPFTTMGFHILSQQHVTSLTECFKLCLKIFACKVVGYKEAVSYNVCQIRDGISGDELKSKGKEQFHYYSVDRD